MISSPSGVFICSDCVRLCNNMVQGEEGDDGDAKVAAGALIPDLKVPKPADIKKVLDDYVVGQEHVKKNPVCRGP